MRSIGARLALWYAAASTATLACLFVVGYYLLRGYLIHGLDLLYQSEFQQIRAQYLESFEEAAKRCLVLERTVQNGVGRVHGLAESFEVTQGTRGKGPRHADLVVGGHHRGLLKSPKGHDTSMIRATGARRLTSDG